MCPFTLSLWVLSCVLAVNGHDFFVNADSGTSESFVSDDSITWVSPLTSESSPCSGSGVLKLNFSASDTGAERNKILVDMTFNNPVRFTFNIGDSPSNDGYGGDDDDNSRDAEIYALEDDFYIYMNDNAPNPRAKQFRRVEQVIKNRFQVIISDGRVVWNDQCMENNFDLDTDLLFALNDQADTQGDSDRVLWFGINRSIGDSSRGGSGLCWADITWLA